MQLLFNLAKFTEHLSTNTQVVSKVRNFVNWKIFSQITCTQILSFTVDPNILQNAKRSCGHWWHPCQDQLSPTDSWWGWFLSRQINSLLKIKIIIQNTLIYICALHGNCNHAMLPKVWCIPIIYVYGQIMYETIIPGCMRPGQYAQMLISKVCTWPHGCLWMEYIWLMTAVSQGCCHSGQAGVGQQQLPFAVCGPRHDLVHHKATSLSHEVSSMLSALPEDLCEQTLNLKNTTNCTVIYTLCLNPSAGHL